MIELYFTMSTLSRADRNNYSRLFSVREITRPVGIIIRDSRLIYYHSSYIKLPSRQSAQKEAPVERERDTVYREINELYKRPNE